VFVLLSSRPAAGLHLLFSWPYLAGEWPAEENLEDKQNTITTEHFLGDDKMSVINIGTYIRINLDEL
jgi:hypothetical protein